MSVTTTEVPLFEWDNEYDNVEQVRPYMDAFVPLHDEFERTHGTAYNSLFKGKIPGLAGSPREDTGIYLLQTLLDLDRLGERVQQFLDAGGYRLSDRLPGPQERGTLVHVGFYMGGTGWAVSNQVTVSVNDSGNVLFRYPRQRNWRTHHAGPDSYLFKPDQKGRPTHVAR